MRLQLPDGHWAVVPLIRSGRRWSVYDGLPLDGHNAFMRDDGLLLDGPSLQAALQILERWKVDRLMLNFWPQLSVVHSPKWQLQTFDASIIDLADGADVAIERMDGKSRRMAGQAVRRGVECRQSTDTAAIDAYYELLSMSTRRWGKEAPVVSKRFLQALVAHGGADVEIWLAHFEGKPIAGLIGLYGSQECYVWSAALDIEMAVLRPHNILHMTLMRAAAARNVRWYNMGSSEGLPNVKRFKDALGAATVPYRRLSRESALYRWYTRFRLRRSSR